MSLADSHVTFFRIFSREPPTMRLGSTLDSRLLVIADGHGIDVPRALGLRPGAGGPLLDLLERDGAAEELRRLDLTDLPREPLTGLRLAAPIARPGKIVGAPVNYVDHQLEMGEQRTI